MYTNGEGVTQDYQGLCQVNGAEARFSRKRMEFCNCSKNSRNEADEQASMQLACCYQTAAEGVSSRGSDPRHRSIRG